MKFQRVLLITPPIKTDLGPVRPNIGLGYLAQMLLDNNISYDVLDMLLGYSLKELKEKVDNFRPDLLGVNIFSNKYKTAYRTIESIKEYFPSMKVVVGGPHVSCVRTSVLDECPAIDYAIISEGEYPLLELCTGKNPEQIDNLIYRQDDKVVMNNTRRYVRDLDSFHFPTYEKFEIEKYIDEKSLISSRGCPYDCTYCAVKVVIGKQVRVRGPENVVDEIEYWYKRGYKQFSFQDDNFTLLKERAFKICDEIERRGFNDIFLRCAGARADRLDSALLGRMKKAGFKTIAMGVEAGNDKILKVLKKGENFEAIDKAVKVACELGYDVYLNFLAGSPYETFSDVKDSVNFALKYPIFYAEWANIIPYPNTELYNWLLEKGYLLKKPEEYLNDNSTTSNIPVFETPELSFKERGEILIWLKRVRNKVLRKGIIHQLKRKKVPWGLRHCMGYIASIEFFRKLIFQNKLRRIADYVRFSLYMRNSVKG